MKNERIAMKKLLILAGVIGLMTTTQCFAQEEKPVCPQPPAPCENQFKPANCDLKKMPKCPKFEEFEKKLKLTDEQKVKVKAIRDAEKEQIKSVLDKIGEKMKEEKAVMDKRLTFDERQAALAPIRKDIHELRSEIHKIKSENKAKFESVLTSKQVKKLEKMKKDAAKKFKNHRPCEFDGKRPPMPQCWEKQPKPEFQPEK